MAVGSAEIPVVRLITRERMAAMTIASVSIDAAGPSAPLERIWMSFGYDELNWTATPRGRANMGTLHSVFGGPAVVRAHNLLTSGNARGLPHWSSGNVYHEDASGNPMYDWGELDKTFDVWIENGMVPLVELGFCPIQLSRASPREFNPMPSLYGAYESWGWASPPRDENKWAHLVEAVVRHCVERYGRDEVSTWYWELWNEPDIAYWQGTVEEYCRFYDHTVGAVRKVLPGAAVGGPATTGGGTAFLEAFLRHCTEGINAVTGEHGTAIDFVSFHTKGAPEFRRTYGPIGRDGALAARKESPSTQKMLEEINTSLGVIRAYSSYRDIPVFVDECDPGVPAHMGVFDNENYGFRNNEYYAVFQLQLMAALLEDRSDAARGISLATAWAWYMENDRYFEGTRSFFTASDIALPVTNSYRMLARLGTHKLAAEVGQPTDQDTRVGALASSTRDGGVSVIVWNHDDDQQCSGSEAQVDITIANIGMAGSAVRIREYLIDRDHSNSHTAWLALGAPQNPSPDEIVTMRTRGALEVVAEERMGRCPRLLARSISLRQPGAALLEVVPL